MMFGESGDSVVGPQWQPEDGRIGGTMNERQIDWPMRHEPIGRWKDQR